MEGAISIPLKDDNMNRIKVLIADNHRDFRKVVHNFLNQLPNVSVVGEATDGNDVVKKMEKLFPDVVLMEFSMPLMNGIEATRIIKQRWPATKVLIDTTFDDPGCRMEAFNAKADGYILKEMLTSSLEEIFCTKRKHT